MSGGYYLMHRGWMDNPVFQAGPFCEQAAWAWMIDAAAYEAKRVRASTRWVDLERGQLTHSVRFMAQAWGWEQTKVRRFLQRLEGAGMITKTRAGTATANATAVCTANATAHATDNATASDNTNATGQGVITICNYEKFQNMRKRSATDQSEVDATPDATVDATPNATANAGNSPQIITNLTNLNEAISAAAAPASGKASRRKIRPEAKDLPGYAEWYDANPNPKDPGAAVKAYRAALNRGATPAELLAGIKAYAAEVAGREKRFIKHPTTWLNAEGWKNYTTPTAAIANGDPYWREEARYRDFRKDPESWLSCWGDPIRDTPEAVRRKVDAENITERAA